MSSQGKRIAKNTLMLYIRQIAIMLIGLYTVRIVLEQLGVEDYGVYSVIGGIVGFFSFLSGTMASATQRFFSFLIGRNDIGALKKTFSVNLIIYISLAFGVYILLETVGLWFVTNELYVPVDRVSAAIFVYHFSALTFIATIITTPFTAIIIAHEDMQIYAYVSIVEVIMKLGTVFMLSYIPMDKLELYGILIFGIAIVNTLMYVVICVRRYDECQFRKLHWDRSMFKEIAGFTGWTMFGQITSVARNQAITILVNQMFNPVIVAARAIANNVTAYLYTFSNSFNTGLYPPIIKSYAAGNKEEMYNLIFKGSKITFFLMWVFTLPLLIEMEPVLMIWLKEVPPLAVIFTQLTLIEVLVSTISLPINTAARAPGKMKFYELTLGSMQIAVFFLSWLFLALGYGVLSIYFISIFTTALMFVVRLFIVKRLIGLPVLPFVKLVLIPIVLAVAVSAGCSFAVRYLLPTGIVFVFVSVALTVIITSWSIYALGLNSSEKIILTTVIKNKFNNILKIK